MVRSIVFGVLFYVTTVLFLILGSPLLLAPRKWALEALKAHARTELWLMKHIVGLNFEVRGLERLPDTPMLVASKHQSAWETFALIPVFRDPALLMKRELFWIPLHGWFSHKFQMIPVDRDKGPTALRTMLRHAKSRVEAGREIIIFPEGTRRPPGAPPAYNSGLFWPRRTWHRKPGTIIVEILDPIPPGLPKAEFMTRLQTAIETASDRLVAEANEEAGNR